MKLTIAIKKPAVDPTVNISLYQTSKNPVDQKKILQSDFDKRLTESHTQIPNSILPPAVRYLDYSRGIVLFERPPMYANFNFTPYTQNRISADRASSKMMKLPIPWQRYVAFLAPNGLPHKLYVFFAENQMTSLDNDPLCFAPLPNIYNDCSVCLPVYNHVDVVNYNMIDAVYNLFDIVWSSGFNLDVWQAATYWTSNVSKTKNPLNKHSFENQISWYQNWATHSLETIMTYSWNLHAYHSFNSFIEARYNTEIVNDYYENVLDLYLASK